jgi:hypothetical protein
MSWRIGAAAILSVALLAAQKYTGPRPQKPDVPYLLHADALVPAEIADAKEVKKKDDITYVVEGPSSSAKTPLAGPVFLFEDGQLSAEKLQLYKFEVKNGHREVVFSHKGKLSAKSRRIAVNPLGGGLYKIEVDESLENGEYGLTPEGSNQVFCFAVY